MLGKRIRMKMHIVAALVVVLAVGVGVITTLVVGAVSTNWLLGIIIGVIIIVVGVVTGIVIALTNFLKFWNNSDIFFK